MSKFSRILVCGGRTFTDTSIIFGYLDFKSRDFTEDAVIIHGAARGADSKAGEWAHIRGYKVEEFPAKWNDLAHPDAVIATTSYGKLYNKNAGFIRNQQMLVEGKPDLVIAFPGGGGTENMIKQSKLAGLAPIRIKKR